MIFGLLNVINFAHNALYMLGAFVAWMRLSLPGVELLGDADSGYWSSGCSAYSLKSVLKHATASWTTFTGC